MSELDRKRIAAVRVLEVMGATWSLHEGWVLRVPVSMGPPDIPIASEVLNVRPGVNLVRSETRCVDGSTGHNRPAGSLYCPDCGGRFRLKEQGP